MGNNEGERLEENYLHQCRTQNVDQEEGEPFDHSQSTADAAMVRQKMPTTKKESFLNLSQWQSCASYPTYQAPLSNLSCSLAPENSGKES